MADEYTSMPLLDSGVAATRLEELRLDFDKLLSVVDAMHRAYEGQRTNDVPNKSGTCAYFDGVEGLRSTHGGHDSWEVFSPGAQGIVNRELGTAILVASVDTACGNQNPKGVSDRGSTSNGANRFLTQHDFGEEFADFDHHDPDSNLVTYWLMADRLGNAELSAAAVENGKFTKFGERIRLTVNDIEDDTEAGSPPNEPTDDFDPPLERKRPGV